MSSRTRFFPNPYPDYSEGGGWQGTDKKGLSDQIALIAGHLKANATADDADGSLYIGPAGIAFAFYHKAANLEQSRDQRMDDLRTALRLADWNLDYFYHRYDTTGYDVRRAPPGFLLGVSGAHAIRAAVCHALGDVCRAAESAQAFSHLADTFFPLEVFPKGCDELLVGRAGYICGALWLNNRLSREVVKEAILWQLCDVMMESGAQYSRRHRSASPLMYAYHGTEYLGAAHGLCSILQMFLTVPGYFQQLSQEESQFKRNLVVGSIDFLLSIQQPNGNFPSSVGSIRSPDRELVHWCHGAPGTVYLMARAYRVIGDPKYLDSALRCGEIVWQHGLLKKGPGICHGVAGSGYVFLLLHSITKDQKYLYRAQKFADFMKTEVFQSGARQPGCPLSLYEGWAGTMCYLVNLLNSHNVKSQFPFFENCLE